jgi:hypothetical protein
MVIIAKDQVREPLYAIVPVFNPWRWKSRYKHTDRAIKHFSDSGAVVVLVEIGFNRRELVYADSGLDGSSAANCGVLSSDHRFKHKYIGLHTKDELWLKENAINVGIQHLPYDWQQMCWLDSDVHFVRPNWVGECIHKLQHYQFLQMFSHARDLGPDYEVMPEGYPHADGIGFVQAWVNGAIRSEDGIPVDRKKSVPALEKFIHGVQKFEESGYYPGGIPKVFPGLAWAATRAGYEAVGGLIDVAIWGGSDWHMAHALIEKTEGMMRNDLHRNYQKVINQWYHRCRTHIRRNVGVMSGSIFHNWHGRKAQRGYNAKHSLLAKIGFDPFRHLKRDYQNLWQLHDDRSTAYVQLRDMMRSISTERNEDSIDT